MISRALIKPARQHNETYADYVIRRAKANKVLKEYLRRGKQVWESVKIVKLTLNEKGFPMNPLDGGVVAKTVHVRKKVQGTYRKPQAARTRRGV